MSGYYGRLMTVDQPEYRQCQSHTAEAAVTKSAWTSARCNRLLRPISSKIALLRKETQIGSEPDTHAYASTISAGPSGSVRSVECFTAPARAASNADIDSEWESNPRPRKKIKRTYSGRTKTGSQEKDGNIGINTRATFFENEAVIRLPPQLTLEVSGSAMAATIEATDQCAETIQGQNARENHQSQGLPRQLAPSNWKLLDGICKGFIALLKVTDIQKTQSPSGCRSLFSTCLRQVPKYIAESEVLSKAEDPDTDVDVSSAIYNDLEDFGTMPGGGWEPLGEVVRAHGTKLVTDAIEEGSFLPKVARHLFCLCLDIAAYDEAQCIIESIALVTLSSQSVEKLPKIVLPGLDMIVNNLKNLASRSGRQGLMYLRLSAMLDQGTFPITWISSKPMVAVWNKVIQSIAREDGSAESAAILLRTAVNKSYRTADTVSSMDVHSTRLDLYVASHRPVLRSTHSGHAPESANIKESSIPTSSSLCQKVRQEVHFTISSVLTVLSAITRLQTPAGLSDPNAYYTLIDSELHQLSVKARQTIDLSSQKFGPSDTATLHADSLRLPLLAAGLAEITSNWHNARSADTSQRQCSSLVHLSGLPSSNETLASAGSFLCAVARCCGRARSEDPFEVIQAIVQDLIKTAKSTHHDTQTRKSCEQLAIAAAFAFSEDTSRPTHLDWALQVELTLTGRGAGTPKPVSVRTPARSIRQLKAGYRWEEGICEWIAKTPNLLLPKASDTMSHTVHLEELYSHEREVLKREMPLPSELSPCAVSRQTARMANRPTNVETKALHVLVPAKPSSGNWKQTSKEVRSTDASKWPKKPAYSGSFPRIFGDSDLDELSVPESSQEKESTRALPTIRIPPNASSCDSRRRRKIQIRNPYAAKTSTSKSSIIKESQKSRDHHEPDISDDELAGLFRW